MANSGAAKSKTLRSAFAAALGFAARRRRTALRALLPLMATTVLAADDSPIRKNQAQPVWGHGVAEGQDLRFAGFDAHASHNQTLPARCYTPKRDEQHPLFSRDDSDWPGFYTLSQGGGFARALHARARQLEVSACETGDAHARHFDGSSRIAYITAEEDAATQLREVAHAIAHAHMQLENLSTPAQDEALFSRLNRHLTAEAVAIAAEYVTGIELAEKGDRRVLGQLRAENHPAFQHFFAAYTAAENDGAAADAAARNAAASTVNFLLRRREFVETNSAPVLQAYARELAQPGPRPRRGRTFTAQDARRMGDIGGQAIAAHAAILTPAELAAVSPHTADVVDVFERMHARLLGYTPERSLRDGNPYRNVTTAQFLHQMQASGGIYTYTQGLDRARNARNATYANRRWQLSETFRLGMQPDYNRAQAPEPAQRLWDNMDQLRRGSPLLAPPLTDHANEHNVFICYGGAGGNYGVWQPSAGIIVINPAHRTQGANARVLAHELLHVRQSSNNLNTFYNTYSMADVQTQTLSNEAAAGAIAVLVAIEARLYGDDSLWHFDEGQDDRMAEHMWQVYGDTRRGGADHHASLEAAGLAGYNFMYTRQGWLDVYNANTARHLVEKLAANWFRAPAATRYSLDNIRRTGEVSDSFNFTRNVASAPDKATRFGRNTAMRDLYDYLSLQQLTQSRGARHEETRALRVLMEAYGNPYTGVDFETLAAQVSANPQTPVLHLINCMIGKGVCNAPPPTPPSPRRAMCG